MSPFLYDKRLTGYTIMKETMFIHHKAGLIDETALNIKNLFDDPPASLIREWLIYEKNLSELFFHSTVDWRFQNFKRACFNQELLLKESFDKDMSNQLHEMNIPSNYFKEPGFIITFHFGSYRLLIKWFAIHHIPITLVVSQSVKENQEFHFWNTLKPYLRKETDFNVLDADNPSVLFQILKAVLNGHYVIVFLDGNRGSKKMTYKFKIGNLDLKIPTSIGHMASKFNIPIYPIWTKREKKGICFLLNELTKPIKNNSYNIIKNIESQNSINSIDYIIQLFIKDLMSDPWQWECCFYLEDFL